MNNRTHSTAAFSLVEVALALGVAGFCLIAILGLLPASLKTNQNSTRQTTANGILSAIVADLRATPATSTTSNLFGIQFPRTKTLYFDGNGKVVQTAGDPKAMFFATVRFPRNNDEGGGGSGSQGTNTVAVSGSGAEDNDNDSDNDEGGGGGGSGRTASFAHVIVGWPALAGGGGGDNDDQGGGSSQAAAGSVDTFVGIDRNGASGGGDNDNGGGDG